MSLSSQPINQRYAYCGHRILVTALAEARGWRPEICVIGPDDHWRFIPTHGDLVVQDAARCLEIGRLCAQNEITGQVAALDAGTLH